LEAYNHYVVVSQESGDTVNILSAAVTPIENGDKVYNFLDNNNVIVRQFLEQSTSLNLDSTIEAVSGGEHKKSSNIRLGKVLKGTGVDPIADNEFPTVLGVIGEVFD